MILVGKTGSGKTTLALTLLPAYKHVIAIDPIHVLKEKLPDTFHLCRSPEELSRAGRRYQRLLYQPSPEHMGWESYDLVYHWCFNRGNTMVYTDEALRVMRPSGQAPRWMEACYTAGRQKGVGMITSTQRPAKVDLRVMSEAEHYVAFALKLPQDRKRMAELLGDERIVTQPAKGYGFYYNSGDGDHLGYFSLKLDPHEKKGV